MFKKLESLISQFTTNAVETEAATSMLTLAADEAEYYKGVCQTWRDAAAELIEFIEAERDRQLKPASGGNLERRI